MISNWSSGYFSSPRAKYSRSAARRDRGSRNPQRLVPSSSAFIGEKLQYVEHYNGERSSRSRRSIDHAPNMERGAIGPVKCRERLGGMLCYYDRQAA